MIVGFILLVLVWLLPTKGNMICCQREQSQMLKFIAALIVVIGHQAGFYCSPNETFMRETGLGSCCVSFFLFMSGYGLLYSYVEKQQRLSALWLKRRMLKLVVPALTAMALYVVAEVAVGKEVDWGNLLTYWFVSDVNLRYGWYVSEIIVLYIVFFMLYRSLSVKRATFMICIVVGVAACIMVAIKCAIWYVLGLPCFLMGLLLANHDIGEKQCRLHLPPLQMKLLVSVIVFSFFFLKNFDMVQQTVPMLDKWRYVLVSKFMANIVFIIGVTYILMRLPICKPFVNRGGYFYEVYLVQGATLLVCREWINNDGLFVLFGLFTTVVVAKGMSMVNNWIVKNIF